MAEKSESSPEESTSTPKQDDKPSGNWWDTWLSSAKTKSAEVYSMVKKDLDEIGTAVKCEASHVFSTTSNALGKTFKFDEPESTANAVKKSFSTFIEQVNIVLNPEPDDDEDTEVILSSGDTTMLSTYKKELEALQRVDATYIVPVDAEKFKAWCESIENDMPGMIMPHTADRRLEANPILKEQYLKLVPDAISYNDFWERYLFRVALLQDRLAAVSRKQPIESVTTDPVLANLPLQTPIQESPKKVLSGLEETYEKDEDIVRWEDEFPHDVELTEEQQILLLEEYEKEITQKKINRRSSSKDLVNNNDKPQTLKDELNNTIEKKNKNGRSPKRQAKSDECGNNLVEDYFGDKEIKDDASANSDESWEKEFEIDEPLGQKA
ncbi:PREDICTED: BSD domain-containing protein 1-like isoform X2 [Papilio xuthus]|uniref:BSD domain-containing protein 1 n=1 Tax=Papilio xuthus TaxID=66420 RepID=A0A194QGU6_PAPXU|nr:PREDICTED: BSD domain-containing protein 1-like isoform X2 [Papilio xuthus]KPJ04160.1 BSD domain-containing protein 1 [Papilio xuthus]